MTKWKFSPLELDHQAMLDILRTAAVLSKLSDRFFSQYDISEAQFAVLMSINEEGEKGINQQELSEKLLVHKTNIVGLVDRLEKKGFVMRKADAVDRRVNRLILGENGIKVLKKVEKPYLEEVRRLMGRLSLFEKMSIRKSSAKLLKYAAGVLQQGADWTDAAK